MAALGLSEALGSQLFELIHQLDLVNPLLSSFGENHVGSIRRNFVLREPGNVATSRSQLSTNYASTVG